MNIWEVLGIQKCKEENIIKQAYYEKLKVTNPEDHPEEFKLLRQALEEAMGYARGNVAGSSDLQTFMEKVDEIYQDYGRRIQVDSWAELLEDGLMEEEDMRRQVSLCILKYIASHSFVPHEVLCYLNERFDWFGSMEELSREFPRNFLEFIIANVQYEDIFYYNKLPIMENFDYDGFIDEYFAYRKAYSQENIELCQELHESFKKYSFDNLNVDIISFYTALYLEHSPEKAAGIIEKWCDKEPDAYENFSNTLGFYYQSENQFEEAVKCYKHAVSVCESNYENYVSLLRCLRRMSQYEEALVVIEEASAKFPKEATSLHRRIADLYFDMGNYEKAIAQYELLSEVEGAKQDYLSEIAFCYEAMETADETAEECYLKAIEANSEEGENYRIYGMFLLEKKRVEEAVKYLKKAYQLDPENSFIALCLGKACREAGELNAAKVYFEISLSIAMDELKEDEEDSCILESISDALVQLERLDEALDYANQALKNQYCITSCPGKGCFEAYEHMAQVAEKRGNKEEALKYYEIAEELKHKKRFAKAIHRLTEEIN
ncbi:MAG: tetratricopeptide repeat protein [Lachnospiraceae bacterium]|nr:tetratricopeptide repeat protein [Lachnospiraceae bacterium]